MRCFTGVDFTYHCLLYTTLDQWITLIILLLQLLVKPPLLKCIFLSCRLYLSIYSPFNPFNALLQIVCLTWHISQHTVFRIIWETMSVVAVHTSTYYPILYHHLRCSLPYPLLCFQTLRVGFLSSLMLYLLVCLQLKYFISTLVSSHDHDFS